MLSLKQPLDKEIEIGGQKYKLDLSFDNVLRWYELMDDKVIDDIEKVDIAYKMFVIDGPDIDINECLMVVESIVTEYIVEKQQEATDDDVIEDEPELYYSFDQDAEYIFASFLQEYGIDLEDQKGHMRWEKFIALLNGLRDDTKFKQIIGIRMAELPDGGDEYSQKERERLEELKSIYALDTEETRQREEQEIGSFFNSLKTDAIRG